MLSLQKNHTFLIFILLVVSNLLLVLNSIASDIEAASSQKYLTSQNYLAKGVYYLINLGDLDKAEEQFQKAILSSSPDSFSAIPDNPNDGQTTAEAFYFLGKIYYDRAGKSGDITQNIGKAKFYLAKANEYGIMSFRINPPLLDEVNRKYPNIPAAVQEISQSKTEVVIETQDEFYKLNTIRIDHNLDITKDKFSTNKELKLYNNSRYKILTDYKDSYKSVYGALVIFGIVAMILFTRG
jgi:tetratricopeptide (TPR) repeat protein